MPQLSERVPIRELAPNRVNPTEGNGTTTPRDRLHIILLARSEDVAQLLKDNTRVVRPPLWKGGEVLLHVVTSKDLTTDNALIQQTIVDLGWADAQDLDITGYPTSEPSE